MTAPAPTISPELRALLRRVKLGKLLDTLPERLALAKTNGLAHGEFLELVLADEVTRRDTSSASLRARTAGLDPTMTMDRWDPSTAVTYDQATWTELGSLRFIDNAHNVVIMGPVGVGKTFLATALGHVAVRRRYRVHFERTDTMLRRLKASRLDNSHDAEVRKLLRVDLLILDLCRPRDYPDLGRGPVRWCTDRGAGVVAGAGVVGIVTGRHGHRPSRKARSLSPGRYRPAGRSVVAIRWRACSLMVMSAWR
jgi:hypothetical protein